MSKKSGRTFETDNHKYEVVDSLGEGGVGYVWKVVDENGDNFALKEMKPTEDEREKKKRFRQELEFLKQKNHPRLVPVVDSSVLNDDQSPFYVMPVYETTLDQLIENGINPEKIIEFFFNILDGLEFLHLSGNFHRDLKPKNIFFDANSGSVVIADLGAAHFAEDELFTSIETKPGSRLANFEYAAPEQRRKVEIVDHRADFFALGLILNEMFTKQVPHGSGSLTIEQVAPTFAHLDELVDVMLQRNPDRRHDSVAAIRADWETREKSFWQKRRTEPSTYKSIHVTGGPVLNKSAIRQAIVNNLRDHGGRNRNNQMFQDLPQFETIPKSSVIEEMIADGTLVQRTDIGGWRTVELATSNGIRGDLEISPEVRKKIAFEVTIALSRERLPYEDLLKKLPHGEVFSKKVVNELIKDGSIITDPVTNHLRLK